MRCFSQSPSLTNTLNLQTLTDSGPNIDRMVALLFDAVASFFLFFFTRFGNIFAGNMVMRRILTIENASQSVCNDFISPLTFSRHPLPPDSAVSTPCLHHLLVESKPREKTAITTDNATCHEGRTQPNYTKQKSSRRDITKTY